VKAVKLDVTKQEDIDEAVATITKEGRGLYALVNNAGVATVGSVADTSMEEFDLLMDVNLYGPYRMTKAFTPLITASKGRITNIGSISGVLASKDLSAYAMSKHRSIHGFSCGAARAARRDGERGRAGQLRLGHRQERDETNWKGEPLHRSQQIQEAG
jgi:NAD(P)-dependent dehydrogenase (short-subunit alcohol dehydrogenase family)